MAGLTMNGMPVAFGERRAADQALATLKGVDGVVINRLPEHTADLGITGTKAEGGAYSRVTVTFSLV